MIFLMTEQTRNILRDLLNTAAQDALRQTHPDTGNPKVIRDAWSERYKELCQAELELNSFKD